MELNFINKTGINTNDTLLSISTIYDNGEIAFESLICQCRCNLGSTAKCSNGKSSNCNCKRNCSNVCRCDNSGKCVCGGRGY